MMTLKLPTLAPPFGMTAIGAARTCDANIELRVIQKMVRIIPRFGILAHARFVVTCIPHCAITGPALKA